MYTYTQMHTHTYIHVCTWRALLQKPDKCHSKKKMELQCQCQVHWLSFEKKLFTYAYVCIHVHINESSFPKHDLPIVIEPSIFGLALIAFWKRALYIYIYDIYPCIYTYIHETYIHMRILYIYIMHNASYIYMMHNALCEYKNMEGKIIINIDHNNTDIVDTTTVILHKTQSWLVAPPVAHLWPYSCG